MAHAENIGLQQYVVLCYDTDVLNLVGAITDGGHGVLITGCSNRMELMFMKLISMFHLHTVL